MTVVVPSPTSSSCVLLSSIIDWTRGKAARPRCQRRQSCERFTACTQGIGQPRVREKPARLGCGVVHVNLAEDGVAIVGDDNAWRWAEGGAVSLYRPLGPKVAQAEAAAVLLRAAGRWQANKGRTPAAGSPPEASKIIFNIDRGPSVVRMTSATAWRGQGTINEHIQHTTSPSGAHQACPVGHRELQKQTLSSQRAGGECCERLRIRVTEERRVQRAAGTGRAFAAAILPCCTFLPCSRFVLVSAGGRKAVCTHQRPVWRPAYVCCLTPSIQFDSQWLQGGRKRQLTPHARSRSCMRAHAYANAQRSGPALRTSTCDCMAAVLRCVGPPGKDGFYGLLCQVDERESGSWEASRLPSWAGPLCTFLDTEQ